MTILKDPANAFSLCGEGKISGTDKPIDYFSDAYMLTVICVLIMLAIGTIDIFLVVACVYTKQATYGFIFVVAAFEFIVIGLTLSAVAAKICALASHYDMVKKK